VDVVDVADVVDVGRRGECSVSALLSMVIPGPNCGSATGTAAAVIACLGQSNVPRSTKHAAQRCDGFPCYCLAICQYRFPIDMSFCLRFRRFENAVVGARFGAPRVCSFRNLGLFFVFAVKPNAW